MRSRLTGLAVVGLLACATPARAELFMFHIQGTVNDVTRSTPGVFPSTDFAIGDPIFYTFIYNTGSPIVGFEGYFGDHYFSGLEAYGRIVMTPSEMYSERHGGMGSVATGQVGPEGQYEVYGFEQRLRFEPGVFTGWPMYDLPELLPTPLGGSVRLYFWDPCGTCFQIGQINATIESAQRIPEPTVLSLMLLGGATLGAWRVREHRKS